MEDYRNGFEQGALGRAKLFVKEMKGTIRCVDPDKCRFHEQINGIWNEHSRTVMLTLIVSVLQRVLSRISTYRDEEAETVQTVLSVKEAEEIMFFVAGILGRGC
jgi:hypothetical protein